MVHERMADRLAAAERRRTIAAIEPRQRRQLHLPPLRRRASRAAARA